MSEFRVGSVPHHGVLMGRKMLLCFALVLGGSLVIFACSNTSRRTDIGTKLDGQEDVGGGTSIGFNDKGDAVFQKKVRIATYLRDLQAEVYNLETEIYGNEETGRSGLYGVLRDCKDEARSSKYGGDSKVTPPPTKDIKTRGEDSYLGAVIDKIPSVRYGTDESKAFVSVSEVYLTDRLKRFESYRTSYQERKTWFQEEIRKCKADLKEKQKNSVLGDTL